MLHCAIVVGFMKVVLDALFASINSSLFAYQRKIINGFSPRLLSINNDSLFNTYQDQESLTLSKPVFKIAFKFFNRTPIYARRYIFIVLQSFYGKNLKENYT